MSKEFWKAGNMLYPLPAVMVSCKRENETPNIITVAWTGTVCTNPPMVYISVRKERYSYDIIKKSKEFVINLGTEELAEAVDYCGVKSGRQVDKFKEMNLTPMEGNIVKVPLIKESPVNIECKVNRILELGSHHMFIADVVGVHVDSTYLNEKGKLELHKANPIVYSHGEYYGLNEVLGTFGYSVRKMKAIKQNNTKPVIEKHTVGKQTVEKQVLEKRTSDKHSLEKHSLEKQSEKVNLSSKSKNKKNYKKDVKHKSKKNRN